MLTSCTMHASCGPTRSRERLLPVLPTRRQLDGRAACGSPADLLLAMLGAACQLLHLLALLLDAALIVASARQQLQMPHEAHRIANLHCLQDKRHHACRSYHMVWQQRPG